MRCTAITILNKRCKCKFLYNSLCYTHFKKYNINSIIKIQSVWRSFLTRKKINNLFINLPHELQNLVLYFIREDYRISRLHKSYIAIYNKKINIMNLRLSELYFHYQTIYSMEFEEYLERKILIKEKILYYKDRINEIT